MSSITIAWVRARVPPSKNLLFFLTSLLQVICVSRRRREALSTHALPICFFFVFITRLSLSVWGVGVHVDVKKGTMGRNRITETRQKSFVSRVVVDASAILRQQVSGI